MSAPIYLMSLVLAYLGSHEMGDCPVPPCPPLVQPVEPPDPPPPVVALKVRVAACAQVGQDLDYHICVVNSSPAPAHHVIVRHLLPSHVKLISASPEPNATEPELQWKLGTLRGGGKVEITLVLRPTTDEDMHNCTRVQFEHGQCVTTRLARSPAPAPEEVPTPPRPLPEKVPTKPKMPLEKVEPLTPSPAGEPKLTLTMEGPKQQYINHPTRYFLTVKNTGTGPATNVMVTNQVPDKQTFVRASSPGKFLENQVAWLLATLDPGKSKTVEVVVQAKEGGEYCQKATVLADRGIKAQAELCTTFQGVTALLLEMVDRLDPLEVNGETSYPIVVHNQGTEAATNVRIKVIIPAAMALVRAKGPADNRAGDRTADGSQILMFDPVPTLAPGAKGEYEVFVKGLRAGDIRFRVELTADQLRQGGPVREEESTTIFLDSDQTREPPLQEPGKK